MKNILLFCTLLFCSFSFNNVETDELTRQISLSFQNGNSQLLSTVMASSVELNVESEKVSFLKLSNERAGMILSSFFQKNPPSGFKYIYQGNSSENLKYCVGNYKSRSSDFLIYLLISKNANDRYVVKSLQVKPS